jgi:hypothetical protein
MNQTSTVDIFVAPFVPQTCNKTLHSLHTRVQWTCMHHHKQLRLCGAVLGQRIVDVRKRSLPYLANTPPLSAAPTESLEVTCNFCVGSVRSSVPRFFFASMRAVTFAPSPHHRSVCFLQVSSSVIRAAHVQCFAQRTATNYFHTQCRCTLA